MKKLLSTVLSSIVVSAAILAGCGSGDKPASTNTDSNSQQNTNQPAASTDSGGKAPDRPFVYLAQQVVTTIDPAKHTDETSLHAVINMYDPLVYPKVEEGSMEPGPHIAEKWDISEDGKTYTFKLKEGVKFHSGNELTADDVVYSVQRMIALKQGFSWLWNGILEKGNVKAIDKNTVEFTLNSAYAPFISTLTQLFVVDSATVKQHLEGNEFGEEGDYGQKYLSDNIAGSGPYMINRWTRGSEMIMEKFPDYWKGWTEGQIEEIKYMIVPEEATVKTMLVSGQADMANQWLSQPTYDELKKVKGMVVQEDPSVQLYHLPINTQKAPMDDINFRKAILYAFDYDVANTQILGGAEQAVGPVPLKVPGHNPEVTVYKRDIEKAKEFLAKSKYAGQDIELEFMFISDRPQQRQMGLLLQNNLKDLGIKVKLTGVPWAKITEAAVKPETTAHLTNIFDSLKYPHVDSHTYGIYHPTARGSFRSVSWYDNPQTAEILEKAKESVEVEEQMKYYKEAQKLIVDDAVSIYIANPTHRLPFKDYVEGYKFNGLLGYDIGFYYFKLKK